ncbi:C-13 antigen, putative [Plasmodium relictum]|uniref:C-13 antigen, putative n=1 Tax=Plasmodium relictum TaxID=85471 RepID=A0A1J1H2G1_PLARL|nr:C-13 antigen, putative [Plasmodium relictum]CRG98877.1 C-13 antigen, putative [Plasmodium relictum]
MNYNNNYLDYNIHDRRKVNNANQKENGQWENISYIKNNQINAVNKTNINMSNENYMKGYINNNNNIYTNVKNNNMNLGNYNLKSENNFVNFNSFDHKDKNSINTPSHYVSSHPILGNKRKKEIYNNFSNNLNPNIEMNNEKFNYINNTNNVINDNNLVMNGRNIINDNYKHQLNDNNFGFNKSTYNKLDRINEKHYTNVILNNELRENTFEENNMQFANNLNQKSDLNKLYNFSQPFKNDDMTNSSYFNKSSNKEGEHKGIVHNIFETLTNNVENKNEINNLVKQKVANMVINEIEKKIEINDSSFLCNKLSLLRQYFDVTHAYVVNKILFILIPYIYIRKAICESRTYYVYAHLKKKMELTQKDKHFNSAFALNEYNNELKLKNQDQKNKEKENELNSENKKFFFNKKMNNVNLVRNNSNDINYVDYSNIGIFKADLYIPLMSIITYILLYTLTLTAKKNNFIFKPDNLFNISSYVFVLILLETTIIKFLFLLVCRDINLSFLHILSFISYKFVIMCALIITKIFFYFTYFMYTSIVGIDNESTNTIQSNKTLLPNNSHNVFKNLNNNFTFNFSLYNIILLLNNSATYRFTQFYFYITVSIQMIQIFKSIHLYIHDNSNLLNNYNIKRINILILIFSFSQIFFCWILTPSFT